MYVNAAGECVDDYRYNTSYLSLQYIIESSLLGNNNNNTTNAAAGLVFFVYTVRSTAFFRLVRSRMPWMTLWVFFVWAPVRYFYASRLLALSC